MALPIVFDEAREFTTEPYSQRPHGQLFSVASIVVFALLYDTMMLEANPDK